MSTIGNITLAHTPGETGLEKMIRAELTRFVRKEWPALTLPSQDARPPGARFLVGGWSDTGRPVAPEVLDYIARYAGNFAIEFAQLMHNNSPRTNSTGTAKAWVAGFFEWYMDPRNRARRDDVAAQPDVIRTIERGHLLLAQKECRHIPWTEADVNRPNSLWYSDCPPQALERVNCNLAGCTVVSWHGAKRRAPAVGTLWLPGAVTYQGLTLKLGDEVLSDWLAPPDGAHGHPFATLCKTFNAKTPADLVAHSSDSAKRKTYRVLQGGAYWKLAVREVTVPVIVSFFRLDAVKQQSSTGADRSAPERSGGSV
ncbi:MAG: hypothetical protein WKG03_18380 [Telluria sp.]